MGIFRKTTLALSLMVVITTLNLQAQTDTLTILHVNDSHSNLAPAGMKGGIARAASVIGETRMNDPNLLLLHAGDIFVGDPFFNVFFGVAELKMMLALGFDAMTVGNHEFDLTPAVLNTSLDSSFTEGGFPLLSANLILEDPAVQPLKQYIQPFSVLEKGGVRIGLFGLTTPETNVFSLPAPAVIDTNVVQIAAAMVDTLNKRDCKLIICLSHLGFALDQLVAANIPGIDVIIGGHDHLITEVPVEILNPAGRTTWIVQAGAFYRRIGKLRLTLTNGETNLLDYQSILLDESIPAEPSTEQMVNALITDVEQIYGPLYSQSLEYCDGYFEEVSDSLLFHGYKDTPLGNLVCDAFRAYTGTDIAIEPCGSTAQPLESGILYGFNLFRAVGYGFNTDNGLGFRLATFEISGGALWAGLEFGLSQIEQNDEFLIQVSGMTYVYNPDNDPFERLLAVYIGGEPLDQATVYSVTTNEFVVSILDYLQIPYQNLQVLSGISEFQALQSHVMQLGRMYPYRYGRIIAGNSPESDFWRPTPAPLNLKYQDIMVTKSGDLFVAAEDSGIFRSTDGGKTWTEQNVGLTHHMAFSVAEAPNGDLYAGSWGMFRSTDNGDTWQPSGSVLMIPFCVAFKSESDTEYIFAGTGGGIFRSGDNGASWDTTGNGLPRPNSIDVRDLAVGNDGKIYAATGEGLFQSADNGDTWYAADTVFSAEHIDFRAVVIDSKGIIYAGGNRMYRSQDGGMSWTELLLPGFYGVTDLAVNQNDHLFVSTSGPVYHSGDHGESFQYLESDLEGIQFYTLAVNEEGLLFAASSYAGIFRSTNSTFVSGMKESSWTTPDNFKLMQNYPNPFNPWTTITIAIEKKGRTVLEIFDIQGRKIDTLIDQLLPAGRYSIIWNGRNQSNQVVASGIYIYRLSGRDQQLSRKMVLVR